MKAGACLFALLLSGFAVLAADPGTFSLRDVVDEGSPGAKGFESKGAPAGAKPVYLAETPLLDGRSVASARVQNRGSGFELLITFTPDGGRRFGEITKDRIGKQLGILIDGTLYSAPTILNEITGGSAVISGNFTKAEAEALESSLNNSRASR